MMLHDCDAYYLVIILHVEDGAGVSDTRPVGHSTDSEHRSRSPVLVALMKMSYLGGVVAP